MPFSGTTFYPSMVAGEGANNRKFVTALPANNNSSTCNFASGGANNDVRYILIKPGVSGTTTPSQATAPGTTAQGFGWNFLRSDFNIDPALAPGNRKVPAGNIVLNCVMEGLAADTSTNFGIAARVFRLNADGTYTWIASGETAGLSALAGTADVDVTVTLAAEQTFNDNESLHVEFWFKGRGGGTLGALQQLMTFHIGQPTLRQAVSIVLPGVGLTTRYTRSHAASTALAVAMVKVPIKKVAVSLASAATMLKLVGKRLAVSTTPTVAVKKLLPKLVPVSTVPTTRLRLDVPEAALDRITVGGPADFPLNNPTKAIAGTVRDSAGTPYAGATVQLVRESDGYVAATTTSAADGSYSFARDAADPNTYTVLAWETTGTPTQGLSARGLVPA